jgi:hypothetical protein
MRGDFMAYKTDTGTIMAVDPSDRLDFDGEDASDYALEDGDDTEGLEEFLSNPGDVVEGDLE